MPEPDTPSEAPVPTTIAAEAFVPPVIEEKAVELPAAHGTLLMKQPVMLIVPAPFWPPVGDPTVTPPDATSVISLATNGEVPAPIGTVPAVKVVRSDGPVSDSVPVVVIGPPERGALVAMLVTVPEPPPAIVLHPKPTPEAQVRAFVDPEQDGTLRPLGVVAVSAPKIWFADSAGRSAYGSGADSTAKPPRPRLVRAVAGLPRSERLRDRLRKALVSDVAK